MEWTGKGVKNLQKIGIFNRLEKNRYLMQFCLHLTIIKQPLTKSLHISTKNQQMPEIFMKRLRRDRNSLLLDFLHEYFCRF